MVRGRADHAEDDEDAANIAKVTFGLSPGKVPNDNDILIAIGAALKAVRESLPDVSLMSSKDFFNRVLVKEKTGRIGHFAVPSSMEYDVADLAARAIAAADEDKKTTAAASKAAKRPDMDMEIEEEDDDDV